MVHFPRCHLHESLVWKCFPFVSYSHNNINAQSWSSLADQYLDAVTIISKQSGYLSNVTIKSDFSPEGMKMTKLFYL